MRRQATPLGEFFLGLAVGLALNTLIGIPLLYGAMALSVPVALMAAAGANLIAIVVAFGRGRPSLGAGLIAAAALPLLALGACAAIIAGGGGLG